MPFLDAVVSITDKLSEDLIAAWERRQGDDPGQGLNSPDVVIEDCFKE